MTTLKADAARAAMDGAAIPPDESFFELLTIAEKDPEVMRPHILRLHYNIRFPVTAVLLVALRDAVGSLHAPRSRASG